MISMGLKQQAEQNLKDVKKMLDELKVPFWLEGGTLLGAYRDKDFCVGDEDDVDLCTWDNYLVLKDKMIEKAKEMGFELRFDWPFEICIDRGGSHVDVIFNARNGLEAWRPTYVGYDIRCYHVVPARLYEILGTIEFKGETFYTPSPIEEYLEVKYGDWRTPIHRRDFPNFKSPCERPTYL